MMRIALTFLFTMAFSAALSAADHPDLDRLQGKWEVQKTTEDGQKYTQSIEIKKEKMLFKILSSAGDTVIVATATVKLQKSGPFNTFTTTDIKAGQSEDSLEPVNEERSYVYQLGYQTLSIVANMDSERERPPTLDVYKKVAAAK